MRQLVDVQPACGDVSSDQYAHAALLEIRQRLGARTLALVAVNRRGLDAVLFQLLGEFVRAVFGTGEHQHLAPVLRADQV